MKKILGNTKEMVLKKEAFVGFLAFGAFFKLLCG